MKDENKKKSFVIGYYQIGAWFTVWAIFTFVNAAGVNVYRNAICDYYNVSAAPLLDGATYGGWLGGLVFLVMPMFIQRFGAKKVLLFSELCGGIVFAMVPLSGNVIWLQIGVLLCGVFAGIYGISTPMILVSKWFPKRKGSVMGIVSAGAVGASLIILPIFNLLLKASNVKIAMASVGGFMLLYGIINLFLMKETPQEAGVFPDNRAPEAGEFSEEEEAPRLSTDKNARGNMTYGDALKQKRLWLIAAGWGFMLVALLGLTFIGVSYMLERGVSNDKAVAAVSICGLIQFFISLLSGILDQKFGPVKTAVFFFLFQITGMLTVNFYHGNSSFVVMLGFWLVVGTFGTANNLASSQNLSVFGAANYPLTYNCQCFANSIIKMLGTFIAARSLVWLGDYSMAYKAFAIALILGITCIILGGDKPQKKTKGEENE